MNKKDPFFFLGEQGLRKGIMILTTAQILRNGKVLTDLGAPLLDVVLEPGDVFYAPRTGTSMRVEGLGFRV